MKKEPVVIWVDETRLFMPLTPIWAGRFCALYRTIAGVAEDIEGVNLVVEYMDGATKKQYAAPARKVKPGWWTVYVAPGAFPGLSQGELRYDVVGYDKQQNARWQGMGALYVVDCPTEGVEPEILPHDTYARDPETGLYHRITVSKNEYGEWQTEVDQEGVEK